MNSAYQIRVKGQIDPKLSAWFSDFAVMHTPNGDTLLTGIINDQAALYGLLERCRDFGVTLISVNTLPIENSMLKENKMNWLHVEDTKVIDACPQDIHAIVSDYHVGHPAIVPKQYFTALNVEKGGKGAGTEISGNVRVYGSDHPFHHVVSEPEPGHVLIETDVETGQYTTFTFEPVNGGNQSKVMIASEFPLPGGFAGFMTRLMMPSVVHRMYKQELQQLADYVQGKAISTK